jgi:saccharopine dehydrogenase-like NADP-dependent oxidoreductase
MVKFVKDGVIENAFFTLIVEVVGKEDGRKIKVKNSANFPDLKEITEKFPGATYISYPTGTAAFAFSKAIPKIKNYGVFPPEALDEDIRKDILVELESKGIVISEQFLSASN